MILPVIMPRQGQSVETCVITKWYKVKGDRVSEGDVLFSYETDKASFEEESGVNGILVDVYYDEGEEVPVLSNVCAISTDVSGSADGHFRDERIADAKIKSVPDQSLKESAVPDKEIISAAAKDSETEIKSRKVAETDEDSIKISPRAKKSAARYGVNPLAAEPSGPEGRIIENDIIEAYKGGLAFTRSAYDESLGKWDLDVEGTGIGGRITTEDLKRAEVEEQHFPPQKEYEESKLSATRKIIANAMYISLTTIPQLTINTSFDASAILSLRKDLKERIGRPGLKGITINDMMIYAVSKTLIAHKNLNAHLSGEVLRVFAHTHIGVAVDTKKGLMVPTLFNADLLSLRDLSACLKDLIQKCSDSTIKPDQLKGASFTVTNLGALGIESFTPVINPPQVAILGIGSLELKIKEINGKYEYYPSIGLSLTFDHRAIDGAPAAKFLKDLKTNLESFGILLIE